MHFVTGSPNWKLRITKRFGVSYFKLLYRVNSRKRTHPRIRFDIEKLNDPTAISSSQATIGGRFAPLAVLVDEDADPDSTVTHFDKAVTDKAAELLDKQRRKRKSLVMPEILDLCDQRRDLKNKRDKPEGAKDYREIQRKTRTEMKLAKWPWIQSQCQEVEAYLIKHNNKKAYQQVKALPTEKQGKSTTIQDKSGKCLTEKHNILNSWTEYAQTFTTLRVMGIQQYLTVRRYQMKSIILFYEKGWKQQSKALKMGK